jgi:hypothetical protein
MDLVTLESRKNGDRYHDFCIDDAIFHIKKAHEALEEGLSDPKVWYESSKFTAKVLSKSLPFIVAVQMQESLAEDQESVTGES